MCRPGSEQACVRVSGNAETDHEQTDDDEQKRCCGCLTGRTVLSVAGRLKSRGSPEYATPAEREAENDAEGSHRVETHRDRPSRRRSYEKADSQRCERGDHADAADEPGEPPRSGADHVLPTAVGTA